MKINEILSTLQSAYNNNNGKNVGLDVTVDGKSITSVKVVGGKINFSTAAVVQEVPPVEKVKKKVQKEVSGISGTAKSDFLGK